MASGRQMHLFKPRLFYGWIIALCCFFSAQTYGFFFSLGVFFKPLQGEFGWGAGLISTIHSLHLVVLVVSMPILGRMTDKYGAKRMFIVSAVLMGVGFFLCGTVKEIWHFYLFYLLASLGVGSTTAMPTAIVQKWFVKKKGLALGIAASGIGAGPLLAALLFHHRRACLGYLDTCCPGNSGQAGGHRPSAAGGGGISSFFACG